MIDLNTFVARASIPNTVGVPLYADEDTMVCMEENRLTRYEVNAECGVASSRQLVLGLGAGLAAGLGLGVGLKRQQQEPISEEERLLGLGLGAGLAAGAGLGIGLRNLGAEAALGVTNSIGLGSGCSVAALNVDPCNRHIMNILHRPRSDLFHLHRININDFSLLTREPVSINPSRLGWVEGSELNTWVSGNTLMMANSYGSVTSYCMSSGHVYSNGVVQASHLSPLDGRSICGIRSARF
ncbi:hypothetical protein AKO1_004684 [Acrasis kona]|uniref:Uncharacterized protein n=1 Tax=Acrasis kona TaxID=1008807 RepID=A0AAW2Z602_9EUKA